MTFKWNLTLPPFHGMVEGVEVSRAGIALEFETGSIAEAHGIFQDNGTALSETFGDLLIGRAVKTATSIGGTEMAFTPTGKASGEGNKEADEAAPPRRGRGPNKPKPEANAPAPVAIPGADAPPIAPAAPGPDPLAIPENLRRTAAVAPPVPPAPPAPPAAPPTGILAGKIIAELDKRATGSADGGQALADWLATSAITIKGATYAEAVTVLRLQADEKLGPIAQALGVA